METCSNVMNADAAQEGAFFILLLIYCITLTMDTPEPMFTSR